MKKLTSVPVLIIFIISLLSMSCEKEKSEEGSIIGKWEVNSIKQVTYNNNKKLAELTVYPDPGDYSMQFVDGGSGFQFQDNDITGIFTWELTGGNLKLTSGSQVYNWTVTIDKTTIVWSFTESETLDGVTYNYEYFYTASKIG